MYGLIDRNYKKFTCNTYFITLSISQCFSFIQLIAKQAPTAFHTEKSKVAFSPTEVNIAKPKQAISAPDNLATNSVLKPNNRHTENTISNIVAIQPPTLAKEVGK